MAGRNEVDSKYDHNKCLGVFAITVTGTPASLAADLLANAFANDQAVWLAYFGSKYPGLPDNCLWYISTGAAACGLTSVAFTGVTFSTKVIPANSNSPLSFMRDLSKVKLVTADAVLVIEG